MIRANNAERRLANAQNQLAAAEEKMAAMNQKTTAADTKWEARVKEYETRLRAAEEKVKRERQGYKERVVELENQMRCVYFVSGGRAWGKNNGWPAKAFVLIIRLFFFFFFSPRSLQRQRELAEKRNQQLADIETKVPPHKLASPAPAR